MPTYKSGYGTQGALAGGYRGRWGIWMEAGTRVVLIHTQPDAPAMAEGVVTRLGGMGRVFVRLDDGTAIKAMKSDLRVLPKEKAND